MQGDIAIELFLAWYQVLGAVNLLPTDSSRDPSSQRGDHYGQNDMRLAWDILNSHKAEASLLVASASNNLSHALLYTLPVYCRK